MVVAQYYNILRFGRAGYTEIMKNILEVAQELAKGLESLGRFEILNKGEKLPIIAFKQKNVTEYSLLQLSHKLRERGWTVPAYYLPKNAEDIEIMRIVIRANFTYDMAAILVADIEKTCKFFEKGAKIGAKGKGAHVKDLANIC
jgi:glutamate decarboxylase